jgi:hypothetical protein
MDDSAKLQQRVLDDCKVLRDYADIAEKLYEDGWGADLIEDELEFFHLDINTTEEAEQRLQELGIDPSLVYIWDEGEMFGEDVDEPDVNEISAGHES